jgi:hypothetical protein
LWLSQFPVTLPGWEYLHSALSLPTTEWQFEWTQLVLLTIILLLWQMTNSLRCASLPQLYAITG